MIGRSLVYDNLGRYEEAVNDAEKAILVDRKRFEGFLRRGIPIFILEYRSLKLRIRKGISCLNRS